MRLIASAFWLGSSTNTRMWWTTGAVAGRASAAWTHLSSVKPVGTRKRWYGTVPGAGDGERLGDLEDDVGRADAPALGERPGWRRAAGSPGGMPWSTQASSVARSLAERLRSFSNWPYRGSACQGGMRRSSTTSRIAGPSAGRRRRSAAGTGRPARAGGTTGTSPGGSGRRPRHRSPGRPRSVAPCAFRTATIAWAAARTRGPRPTTSRDSPRSIGQPTTGVTGVGDLAAGEDGVEGLGQVSLEGPFLASPPAVLVVDRPAVTKPPLAVEHKGLARPLGEELVGQDVARVLEHGERDAVVSRAWAATSLAVSWALALTARNATPRPRYSFSNSERRVMYSSLTGQPIPVKTMTTALAPLRSRSETGSPVAAVKRVKSPTGRMMPTSRPAGRRWVRAALCMRATRVTVSPMTR